MTGVDGYEVKEKLDANEKTSLIPFVFLTAKADKFEVRKGMIYGADDYIVKPFDNDELVRSILARLKKHEMLTKQAEILNEDNSYSTDSSSSKLKDKILITVNNQPKFLNVAGIIYIKSDGNYTYVFSEGEKEIMLRKLIKEWEELLPANQFIRIHQSTIINIDFIDKIENLSKRSFIIRLKTIDKAFPVSQRYTVKIKSVFKI